MQPNLHLNVDTSVTIDTKFLYYYCSLLLYETKKSRIQKEFEITGCLNTYLKTGSRASSPFSGRGMRLQGGV